MNHPNQIQDIYDASPLQKGLLFHSLYSPDQATYVVQLRLGLAGELDVSAFAGAWQIVIERHPVFRSSFHWRGLENPVQVVRENIRINVQEYDWRDVPRPLLDEKLESFCAQEKLRGFDLAVAPLIRLHLLRTKDDQHEFIFTFHHLVLDGWSSSIMLQELFACYDALRKNANPGLQVSTPYRNYIAWLNEQDLGRAEMFWQKQFEGFTTPTLLTAGSSGRIAECKTELKEHFIQLPAAELLQFARRLQITLSTLLMGAWGILLGRHTAHDDIVFGNVVSGRPPDLPNVETIVGPFINTLPVRMELPVHGTAASWLLHLHRQQAEARRFEYTPLAELHTWVEVPTDQPLFDTLLIFENYPFDSSLGKKLPGIEISHYSLSESPNYPFILAIEPAGENLGVRLIYDASQFQYDAIARMTEQYRTLIRQIIANPERPLWQLDSLTDQERKTILEEWGEATDAYPREKTISELFEEQAAAQPEAIALVSDE